MPEPLRVDLPPAVRSVDFVSDLHLSPEMPRTLGAFERYLEATRADAVFLLGDMFEAWVGDDAMALPFEARCVAMLAGAARRRPLHVMRGNRDFLLGDAGRLPGLIRLLDQKSCQPRAGALQAEAARQIA